MPLPPDGLCGTFTALVTPFSADGARVDEPSLTRLVDRQLAANVAGVVVCGSTGESPCLSLAEYDLVVAVARERIAGRVPVVAGISISSTDRAVEAGRIAQAAGADALLVAAPPYVKPTQEGIYQHTLAVARATGLPIIAYNIPGRCGISIAPATIARMAADGFVIGAKDSSGSLDNALELLAAAAPGFRVMSGEDSLVWPIMSCGGAGVISASANVVPEKFVTLTSAASAGQVETARRHQLELLPIVRALMLETNPVPVKAALALKGWIDSPAVRLPLVGASAETVARLKEVLGL
jgi:4-hydroxy-tetrahydrodipicolinate synthase